MKSGIKAVIWDMGGVFLRTEARTSRMALAEKYHLSLQDLYDEVFNSESAQKATIGLIDVTEHWENVGERFGVSGAGLLDFQKQFWADDIFDGNLMDFIRSLKSEYKTGLLSNAWSDARSHLTDVRKCMDAFHFSIFSCEVGLAKPDPAIYWKILDMVGVKPGEAIFVDDNRDNILSANQVGIHGILFVDPQQARADVLSLLGD